MPEPLTNAQLASLTTMSIQQADHEIAEMENALQARRMVRAMLVESAKMLGLDVMGSGTELIVRPAKKCSNMKASATAVGSVMHG